MKNMLIVVAVLAVSGILMTSCSLTSNISLSKSHNLGGYSANQGSEKQSDLISDYGNTSRTRSHQYVVANTKETKGELFQEKAQLTTPQPLSTERDSIKKQKRESAVIRDHEQDVIGLDTYSADVKNDDSKKTIAAQPVSPPRSSHGLPLWFIVVCSIIIPPLGVGLMFGIVDKFWICLALTFCFWLPGMIYALIQVMG